MDLLDSYGFIWTLETTCHYDEPRSICAEGNGYRFFCFEPAVPWALWRRMRGATITSKWRSMLLLVEEEHNLQSSKGPFLGRERAISHGSFDCGCFVQRGLWIFSEKRECCDVQTLVSFEEHCVARLATPRRQSLRSVSRWISLGAGRLLVWAEKQIDSFLVSTAVRIFAAASGQFHASNHNTLLLY